MHLAFLAQLLRHSAVSGRICLLTRTERVRHLVSLGPCAVPQAFVVRIPRVLVVVVVVVDVVLAKHLVRVMCLPARSALGHVSRSRSHRRALRPVAGSVAGSVATLRRVLHTGAGAGAHRCAASSSILRLLVESAERLAGKHTNISALAPS